MLRVGCVLVCALFVGATLATECADGEACTWFGDNGGDYAPGVCLMGSCVRGDLLCDDRNACTTDTYDVQERMCEHETLPDGMDDGVNFYCLNGHLVRPEPTIPECHTLRVGETSWLFPALENDTPCTVGEEDVVGMCFDGVCYPYDYENECPAGKCFDAVPDPFGGCQLQFLPVGTPCRDYIMAGWGTGEDVEDGSYCGVAGRCITPGP